MHKMPKEKIKIRSASAIEDEGGFFWYSSKWFKKSSSGTPQNLLPFFSYRDYLTYGRLGLSRRHLNSSLFQSVREDGLKRRLFYKFQIANR